MNSYRPYSYCDQCSSAGCSIRQLLVMAVENMNEKMDQKFFGQFGELLEVINLFDFYFPYNNVLEYVVERFNGSTNDLSEITNPLNDKITCKFLDTYTDNLKNHMIKITHDDEDFFKTYKQKIDKYFQTKTLLTESEFLKIENLKNGHTYMASRLFYLLKTFFNENYLDNNQVQNESDSETETEDEKSDLDS